jgi:hypothetical protein
MLSKPRRERWRNKRKRKLSWLDLIDVESTIVCTQKKGQMISTISNYNFILSLWSEALKTIVYILKRVPSKIVLALRYLLYYGMGGN